MDTTYVPEDQISVRLREHRLIGWCTYGYGRNAFWISACSPMLLSVWGCPDLAKILATSEKSCSGTEERWAD